MHPNRVSQNPSAGEDRVMWSKEHLLNGPLREAENELVQMIHIKLRNVVQFDVHLTATLCLTDKKSVADKCLVMPETINQKCCSCQEKSQTVNIQKKQFIKRVFFQYTQREPESV